MTTTSSSSFEAREEDETCRETYGTFRLIGDDLDPESLTARLGIIPTFAHAKGTSYQSRAGILKRTTGVWGLSTEGILTTTSLEIHLVHLLDVLEPQRSRLIAILEENPSLTAEVFCYWVSASGHGGPFLSPMTLERLANLRLALDFDFYGLDDDGPPPTP